MPSLLYTGSALCDETILRYAVTLNYDLAWANSQSLYCQFHQFNDDNQSA